MRNKFTLIFILCIFSSFSAFAQGDEETIKDTLQLKPLFNPDTLPGEKKEKEVEKGKDTSGKLSKVKEHVTIGGGIGVSTAFYSSFGAPAQRDPFYWQISGSLDLTIGQVSLPFSGTLNQQDRSFTQPFNQYGVSPKYKWITAHLGYRSLRFSEYSLSGNQFLGVGLELAPDKSFVKGKLVYGRFSKAVDGYYTDGQVTGVPSFERWGMGFQVELGKPKRHVGVHAFKAKDDRNSITSFANDVTIKPAENLIFGLSTAMEVSKKLSFNGEINFSAYTRDTRVDETVLEGYTYINNLGSLFYANATSTFNKALKADLSYTEKKYKVGLAYRRVDPDYLSMGSVYLNNDFEDIQAQTSFKAIKNKMSVSLSGGLQRNNLNKDKSTEMLRLISSISTTYIINQHWTAMVNFSNFNTESQMQVVNSLDTMRFAQVTKNASSQIIYNKVFTKVRIASGISVNYQNAKIFQNDTLNITSSSKLVNANYSFQLGLLKSGINITANIGGAMNVTADNEIATLGPTIAINKRFVHGKLSSSVAASTLKSFINGESLGYILNLKCNNNFRINRHHALTNTVSYIEKASNNTSAKQFIATIGYNYVF